MKDLLTKISKKLNNFVVKLKSVAKEVADNKLVTIFLLFFSWGALAGLTIANIIIAPGNLLIWLLLILPIMAALLSTLALVIDENTYTTAIWVLTYIGAHFALVFTFLMTAHLGIILIYSFPLVALGYGVFKLFVTEDPAFKETTATC